jgi:hypothetical protein
VTVDAANVYWADYTGNTLMAVAKGGGTSVTLASSQANPAFIAVDATSAYWTNYNGDAYERVVKLTPK